MSRGRGLTRQMQQRAVGAEIEVAELQPCAFGGDGLHGRAEEVHAFFAMLSRGETKLHRHILLEQARFGDDGKHPGGIEVAQSRTPKPLAVALNGGVDDLRFRRWLVQAAPPRDDGESLAMEEAAGLLPVGRARRFVRAASEMLDARLVGVKQ